MDGEAYITNHGRKRLRQRVGIPSKAAQRLADRALRDGLRHGDIAGAMGRWLDSLFLSHQTANNMRVFGDKVYLFCEERLITVIQIPTRFMKSVTKRREAQRRD